MFSRSILIGEILNTKKKTPYVKSCQLFYYSIFQLDVHFFLSGQTLLSNVCVACVLGLFNQSPLAFTDSFSICVEFHWALSN